MDSRFEQNADTTTSPLTDSDPAQPLKYAPWLLIELERLLGELPGEDQQAILKEVEEHLTCCRLALKEIGLDPSESDREAVQRFGSPESFAAQALLSRNPERRHSKFMVAATAGAVLIALAWFIIGIFNMNLVWPLCVGSMAAFAVCSWKSHLQLKSVLKGGVLATAFLFFYIGLTYVHLGDYGGFGIMPRWQVSDMKADSERTLAQIDEALAQCEPIQMAFRKGESAVKQTPFYSGGAYLAFEGMATGPPDTALYKMVKVTDFRQAAVSWEDYKNNFRGNWRRTGMDATADSVAAEHVGDNTFSLSMAWQGAQAGFFLSVLALSINFAVFVIWLAWDRLRAPRKGLVT